MSAAPYRILSLDGGGSWSLIQVRVLQRLFPEATTGHDVARRFDLVAANSGGAIVAAGLAADLRLDSLLALFDDEATRRQIFVALPWYRKNPLFALFGLAPRYRAAAKLTGLEAVFRAQPQAVDVTSLTPPEVARAIPGGPDWLITAFDYDRRRATFFRSNPESRAAGAPASGPQPSFIGAVHAASNAPVLFFDRPAENGDGHRYWDGAIGGYDNPVLAAVTEALANGHPRESIQAVSLGTGSVFLPSGPPDTPRELLLPHQTPSTFRDATELATSIVDDPPDAASFIAHVALGGRTGGPFPVTDGRLVRLGPLIQPVRAAGGSWTTPPGISTAELERLCALQLDAITDADVALINKLCDVWMADAAPNQPIRADGNLSVEIGHGKFSAALGAARALVT